MNPRRCEPGCRIIQYCPHNLEWREEKIFGKTLEERQRCVYSAISCHGSQGYHTVKRNQGLSTVYKPTLLVSRYRKFDRMASCFHLPRAPSSHVPSPRPKIEKPDDSYLQFFIIQSKSRVEQRMNMYLMETHNNNFDRWVWLHPYTVDLEVPYSTYTM